MSVQTEITRITNARNTIRTKLAELGVGDGTEKLEACAEKVNAIDNKGTVSAEVKEGGSYTIEAGYYKGGTVTGVPGGGNYELYEPDPVTPTKSVQTITPNGKYGIKSVTVSPIPAEYQDVSDVNVPDKYVLSPYVYVDAEGTVTPGKMNDNGAVTATIVGLSDTDTEYTIPEGYHNGNGKVSLTKDIENALAAI